jgi:drug/metabolite transporter (DMT)-like permease
MATFGSIIGLTAYFAGQARMEASEAGLFTYLQPLVYIPLAWFWLGERATWPMLVAVLCVIAGVGAAELPRRPFGRRVHRLISLNKKRFR